jgi:hypothetical protein
MMPNLHIERLPAVGIGAAVLSALLASAAAAAPASDEPSPATPPVQAPAQAPAVRPAVAPMPGRAVSPDPASPAAENPEADIRRLADDDWTVREAATERLREAGPEAVAPLAAAYLASRDAEVRVRAAEIARELYWRHGAAFLGVQMARVGLNEDGVRGVLVQDVLLGTSAERAGLRQGDIIVSVRGVSLEDSEPVERFARTLGNCTRGSSVRLALIRGGRRVEMTVTLGGLPAHLIPAKLQSMAADDVRRFDGWWQARLTEARDARRRGDGRVDPKGEGGKGEGGPKSDLPGRPGQPVESPAPAAPAVPARGEAPGR